MSFRIFGTDIILSPLFVALLCVLLLIDTTGLMLSGLICALLHESGHLCAMKICGDTIEKILFYPCGIDIRREKSKTSYKKDLCISVGGCIVNLITACVCYPFLNKHFVFSIFISSIALCIFNMLPIRGLDGEQALKYLLLMKYPPNTVIKVTNIISIVSVVLLFAICVCLWVSLKLSPLLLVCAVYLFIITIMQIRLK